MRIPGVRSSNVAEGAIAVLARQPRSVSGRECHRRSVLGLSPGGGGAVRPGRGLVDPVADAVDEGRPQADSAWPIPGTSQSSFGSLAAMYSWRACSGGK